jgi:hypothetical protein
MVISATNFSGGVINAGTIGAGGVTVISSTFLTGGFLNSNLISGAPTGIAVRSGSTIHGAIVDSGGSLRAMPASWSAAASCPAVLRSAVMGPSPPGAVPSL